MHEQDQRPTLLVEASDYERIVERLDETTLRAAYIGRWESREAFGQELLEDTSAARQLGELPEWLQP